jgi:hypothetical protein
MHYYVYYQANDGRWVYERTCGTEEAAKNRVVELKTLHNRKDATYTIDTLLEGASY